jgi:hypothetical protein
MTTSGAVSLARTRAPVCTSKAPVRPETGAMIFVYCSCSLAFSSCALSESRAAAAARGRGRGLVVIGLRHQAALQEIRVSDARRFEITRRGGIARQHRFGLLDGRLERPRVEREERLSLLDVGALCEVDRVSWPVTCARTSTVVSGSPVPTVVTSRGTVFSTAVAMVTGTAASPRPRLGPRPRRHRHLAPSPHTRQAQESGRNAENVAKPEKANDP